LAQGHTDEAIGLFTLSNTEYRTAFSVEALASAYQKAGKTAQAITWYEEFLSRPARAIAWEPQQLWLAAHRTLAADYLAKGDREKARQTLGSLLDLWKDADPGLPLLKSAKAEFARL